MTCTIYILTPEPIVQKVDGYYRKPFRTRRAELIKDLPVREIPCDISDEDMYCDQCGTTLKLIGYEKVHEELEYIPAKLQIVRYNRAACECPKCKHTEHPFIKKAESPSSLMNHSLASPSSVANVMYILLILQESVLLHLLLHTSSSYSPYCVLLSYFILVHFCDLICPYYTVHICVCQVIHQTFYTQMCPIVIE